jgi:hypothetical protein
VPALAEVGPEAGQDLGLRRRLDALGDDGGPEAVRHLDHGPHDRHRRRFGEGLHERHVDLHHVGLERRQQVERGVAGAHVVERHLAPLGPVVLEDAAEVGDVVDAFALGHLEHQLRHGDAGLPGRPLGGAEAHLRAVDRRRDEVHEEGVGTEPAGRPAEGRLPADAVEGVGGTGGVGGAEEDVGEHRPSVEPGSQQRLVGHDLTVAEADEGLVHAEEGPLVAEEGDDVAVAEAGGEGTEGGGGEGLRHLVEPVGRRVGEAGAGLGQLGGGEEVGDGEDELFETFPRHGAQAVHAGHPEPLTGRQLGDVADRVPRGRADEQRGPHLGRRGRSTGAGPTATRGADGVGLFCHGA